MWWRKSRKRIKRNRANDTHIKGPFVSIKKKDIVDKLDVIISIACMWIACKLQSFFEMPIGRYIYTFKTNEKSKELKISNAVKGRLEYRGGEKKNEKKRNHEIIYHLKYHSIKYPKITVFKEGQWAKIRSIQNKNGWILNSILSTLFST